MKTTEDMYLLGLPWLAGCLSFSRQISKHDVLQCRTNIWSLLPISRVGPVYCCQLQIRNQLPITKRTLVSYILGKCT